MGVFTEENISVNVFILGTFINVISVSELLFRLPFIRFLGDSGQSTAGVRYTERGGVKLGSIFNPMIKVPVLKGIYLISQARERLEMFLQHFVFAEVTRKEQLQIMLLER